MAEGTLQLELLTTQEVERVTKLHERVDHLLTVAYPDDIKINMNAVSQLPLILSKYMEEHYNLLKAINVLHRKRDLTESKMIRYYNEAYAFKLTGTLLKTYVESDENVMTITHFLKKTEMMQKQLYEVINEFREIKWISKTSLDYQKFEIDG
jgi:hypothetical protein